MIPTTTTIVPVTPAVPPAPEQPGTILQQYAVVLDCGLIKTTLHAAIPTNGNVPGAGSSLMQGGPADG